MPLNASILKTTIQNHPWWVVLFLYFPPSSTRHVLGSCEHGSMCELGFMWTGVHVNLHPSVNLDPCVNLGPCASILGSLLMQRNWDGFVWFFFFSSGCRTIVWVQRHKTSLGHLMQQFTLCRVMEVEDLIHQVFSIPLGVWLGTMQTTGSWSLPHLTIRICWWSISSAKMAVSLTVSPSQESIQTFWAAIIQIPETALSPQMQICNYEVQIIICLTDIHYILWITKISCNK